MWSPWLSRNDRKHGNATAPPCPDTQGSNRGAVVLLLATAAAVLKERKGKHEGLNHVVPQAFDGPKHVWTRQRPVALHGLGLLFFFVLLAAGVEISLLGLIW
jgi:hypothetical protein